MQTKISKWGNSLAIRIPAALAAEVSFTDGDVVELSLRDGAILVKARAGELRMDDLLDLITDENLHEPVDFGPPVGKELL
ncbi:MAG: AbrB/MazE/SpoVT family DNA-binding domain-containing protein [Tepidiformaceae bacterium]